MPKLGSPRTQRVQVLDTQDSFVGGLNVSAAPFQMGAKQMRRAENARLDPYGGVSKRGGTRYLHTSAINGSAAVQGGFSWFRTSAQQLAVVGGRLYTATYALPTNWTAQGNPGDFSTTFRVQFAAFRDNSGECVYIVDGGALNKWDGTTLTLNIAGTPADLIAVWMYNRRLHAIRADSQTLVVSALDNGDTLGNTGSGGVVANVRTFGQSNLVAGGSLKASSMMIHRGGVSRFTGWSQDDIAIEAGTRGVSNDVGTIYARSFFALEDAAFFLTERGFYLLTENGVQNISRPIEPVIRNFDAANANNVCVGHHREFREIWWFLPELGCYAYNYEVRSWTGPHTGVFLDKTLTTLWSTVDSSNNPVFLAGTTDGFVIRVDAENTFTDQVTPTGESDSGDIVQLVAECRPFFSGSTLSTKSWRWAYVNAQLKGSMVASLTMHTASGYAVRPITGQNLGEVWDPEEVWDPSQVWSGQKNVVYRVPLGYNGVYLMLTIQESGKRRAPVFNQIDVIAFDLGAR